MPKAKKKKKRRSSHASRKRTRLKAPPMKEIEDTALVINKLIQNVAKMTSIQRTKVSVMLAHAMLGVGLTDA